MTKTLVKVGPADHGKRMSLEEFDKAEAKEGHRYELSRGVLTVSDIPGRKHLAQWNALRRQFGAYDVLHPGRIDTIAGGGEAKILLADFLSERHPDLLIYKSPADEHDEDTLWATWVPEIVIEIVSPGSELRDYQEKPEEYLQFGVREYWIVDAARREMSVLRRVAGKWRRRVVRPPEKYTTRLLPGFELDIADVFAAADRIAE
jgi:Uma2 family endonuclease